MTIGSEPTSAEAQTALIAELQHRVRNTLATTRMVARRSAELSENLEDYAAHLDGRLAAMARVQAMMVHDPGAGVDLARLVIDELTSVHAYQDGGARVDRDRARTDRLDEHRGALRTERTVGAHQLGKPELALVAADRIRVPTLMRIDHQQMNGVRANIENT